MLVVGLDEHHRPRAIEGALPGRSLSVWNVETPSGSGSVSGKPTVRRAQLPGGHRMTKKQNAGSRKAPGNHRGQSALRLIAMDNWPDTGLGGPARKGADVVR
jgi:hypothetical protein